MHKKLHLKCQVLFTGGSSQSNIFPCLQSWHYLGCSHLSRKRLVACAQLKFFFVFCLRSPVFCHVKSPETRTTQPSGKRHLNVSIFQFLSNLILAQKYTHKRKKKLIPEVCVDFSPHSGQLISASITAEAKFLQSLPLIFRPSTSVCPLSCSNTHSSLTLSPSVYMCLSPGHSL